jgi:2-deoxy-D-gluconate 3-dehydrogenase
VFVTGRAKQSVDDSVGSLRAQGVDAHGIAWDVTDTERAEEVVRSIVAATGRLDILVNNAGIIERSAAEEFSLDAWQRVLSTNLTAAFTLSQAAGRVMIGQGRGRIVNVASVLGFSGGRNVVAYSAAKGGLVQLTRALAVEWSAHGVTVNAIAAGYVDTDLTAALRADPERYQSLLSRIPAGRWGTPEDLVGAAVFLSSDASAYVTGAILAVDGGWLAA